ncbi:hypothetical protein [Streptomyces sp. CA-179760]
MFGALFVLALAAAVIGLFWVPRLPTDSRPEPTAPDIAAPGTPRATAV